MAEALLLSLASKILVTTASALFAKAYKENSSWIWGAEKELEQLQDTMRTVQARLDDVRKRGSSTTAANAAIVKNWMERIGDVLHEADDLFDEVVANELLKQQMKENKLLKEVKVSFSKLNPVISDYSISKKVKNIRKRLENIPKDLLAFSDPVQHQPEEPIRAIGTGPFINPQEIVGRDGDLQSIRDFLLGYTTGKVTVPVIAIVGIGGIGKSTLARLICCDTKVNTKFEKIWWADVPDVYTQTDVLLRIFESIEGRSYGGGVNQLHARIGNLVTKTTDDPRNYLLILDGVLDRNLDIWYDIIGLLSTGAKGSSIIVTTRYPSVAKAMRAIKTHTLYGLSPSSSQELFERIAFLPGQLDDARRKKLGEEIRDRCANNPLAIKSIATLLCSRSRIQDWQSVRDDPKLQYEGADPIISRLRLSFDHLKPELKPCFAYCCLFPKRYKIVKEELIDLWIAQGYVKETVSGTLHSVGDGYFNELVGLNFFQELEKDKQGEIIACQLHDLYHQLAEVVAGEQSVILTEQFNHFTKRIRHVAVGYQIAERWTIPNPLLHADRLRSSLFMYRGSLSAPVVDKLVTEFKFLRALDLEDLKVDKVSKSVGSLKHLRYLNLSGNTFISLPDSLSKLVNLLTLDISRCEQLKALPDDFSKLINLRVLNAEGCCSLKHMPSRFREMTSLEYLSYFNVGEKSCKGGFCGRLENLILRNHAGSDHQLPINVRVLHIQNPTNRMPHWADVQPLFTKLEKLHIYNSQAVKGLPPFRCLASLKDLQLSNLEQLEYIEESKGSTQSADTSSTSSFFPSLQDLTLRNLPNLKGWLNQSSSISAANQMPQFSTLYTVRIEDCIELKSIPLSESLQTLELRHVNDELVKHLPSASKHLTALTIWGSLCLEFKFESLTLLQYLELGHCNELRSLYLTPPKLTLLEELQIEDCPNLESYGLNNNAVMDWAALPRLHLLTLNKIKMPRDNYQPISVEREESQD